MAGGFTPWGVVRIVYAGGLLVYTGVIVATLIQVQDIHMSLGLIGVVLALAGLSFSLVSTVTREITGQVRDENSGTPGEKILKRPYLSEKKWRCRIQDSFSHPLFPIGSVVQMKLKNIN